MNSGAQDDALGVRNQDEGIKNEHAWHQVRCCLTFPV